MSHRTRLLLGFAAVALVPLTVFALGVRAEMGARIATEYERRVATMVSVIEEDLAVEAVEIAERLDGLKRGILADNRFRLAVRRAGDDRRYVLDYAARGAQVTGLSMLQIQDEHGRILSSGHFRNEYDRLEPDLPDRIREAPGGVALVRARNPEGRFLVLARVDSFELGGRRFDLVGGRAVGRAFLRRLARDEQLAVSLVYPEGALSSRADLEARLEGRLESARADPAGRSDRPGGPAAADPGLGRFVVAELEIPFVDTAAPESLRDATARFVATHPLAPLEALRRSIDVWAMVVLGLGAAAALLLAVWLSSRISRPLAALARKTSAVDLDRLDVEFASDRSDEIGVLSRLMGAMTERLRAGARRLRDAERRATVGAMARQVNHDIKNGLVPIRNVVRHLAQVRSEAPDELPAVFAERQGTMESSIAYLESLATKYARLYPSGTRTSFDLNSLVRDATGNLGPGADSPLRLELADDLPPLVADPVALRRILENLVTNALDSLEGPTGTVTLRTELAPGDGAPRGVVIRVTDTGHGLSRDELERIFRDFYTTKRDGSGLGLSIVRRLVTDLGGTLGVESEAGVGTEFIVGLPLAPETEGMAEDDGSDEGAEAR